MCCQHSDLLSDPPFMSHESIQTYSNTCCAFTKTIINIVVFSRTKCCFYRTWPAFAWGTTGEFCLVNAQALGRVFSQVNPTTRRFDPVPTPLIKKILWILWGWANKYCKLLSLDKSLPHCLRNGSIEAPFDEQFKPQLRTCIQPAIF